MVREEFLLAMLDDGEAVIREYWRGTEAWVDCRWGRGLISPEEIHAFEAAGLIAPALGSGLVKYDGCQRPSRTWIYRLTAMGQDEARELKASGADQLLY